MGSSVSAFPEPDPGIPDHRTPLRYLLWLARDLRLWMVLGGGLGIVQMLGQALIPAAIGEAIEAGVIGQNKRSLVIWSGTVLSLAVVQAIAGMLRDRCALMSSLGAAYKTIQCVTRHICKLGAGLPHQISKGEALSVGLVDVASIRASMDVVLARGLGAIVAIIVVAAIMLSKSWQLGLIVLIGVLSMTLAIGALIRPLSDRQGRLREQQGELADRGSDIASGLRVLRGIGGEVTFAERYRYESQRVRHAGVEVVRVVAWFDAARVLLPGVVIVCVVAIGARFTLEGQLSVGQLVAFYGYAVFLANPVRRVVYAVETVAKAYVAARRVTKLLSLGPTTFEEESRSVKSQADGEITDPTTGLNPKRGQLTAVVCSTSGDAMRLAERLGGYVLSDVTYGRQLLSELALDEVRRKVLVSDNNSWLFSGKLRTELDPTGASTRDALEQAVDAAAARDIIEAVPHQLYGNISQAGREFSGGQQQRLRLVRALMYDPEVLVLVEPTNAVDANTEAKVAEGVREYRSGRTTVIFATSPLILETANEVLFVENMKVVTVGSHVQLLLSNERYRACVMREGGSA